MATHGSRRALPFACAGLTCSLRLERGEGSRVDPRHVALDAVVSLLASAVEARIGRRAGDPAGAGGETGPRPRGRAEPEPGDDERPRCGPVRCDRRLVRAGMRRAGHRPRGRRAADPRIRAARGKAIRETRLRDTDAAARERELFGEEAPAGQGGIRVGRLEAARGGTRVPGERRAGGPGAPATAGRAAAGRVYSCVRAGLGRSWSSLRIVAGTGGTLEDRVGTGQVRRDLRELLQGAEFRVPSLRERPEDIDELVSHFVRRCGEDFGRLATGVQLRGDGPAAGLPMARQRAGIGGRSRTGRPARTRQLDTGRRLAFENPDLGSRPLGPSSRFRQTNVSRRVGLRSEIRLVPE